VTYLEFELEATVKNLSGAEEKLHASFLIDYSFDSEQTAETASIQLKVTPDMKYLVYALGKNGEPKSGYEVEFQFKNVYLPNAITQILQTNDEGVIELGELSDIQYLTAIASGNYAKWDVLKSLDETKVLLPPSFCVQANKEFKITCPTQLSESNYSIYSIGAGQ
jgi:hypothetical protein